MRRSQLAALVTAMLLFPFTAVVDEPGSSPPILPVRTEYSLQAYPLGGNEHETLPRDGNGIVTVSYDGRLQYNPVTIAQCALYYYSDWLSKKSTSSGEAFMRYADWLVSTQTGDGLWLYTFAYEGQPVPWWSAMAQGLAIAVLLRAASVSHDPRYMSAATLALGTFERPPANRGVAVLDGGTWYEEYMAPAHLHVLNGMIIAMTGPYEYFQATGDIRAQAIWNAGLDTLAANLSRFDSGDWSYYDLAGTKATEPYHVLHIRLLAVLYKLTGRQVFETYRARFQAYYTAAQKHSPAPSPSRPGRGGQSHVPTR